MSEKDKGFIGNIAESHGQATIGCGIIFMILLILWFIIWLLNDGRFYGFWESLGVFALSAIAGVVIAFWVGRNIIANFYYKKAIGLFDKFDIGNAMRYFKIVISVLDLVNREGKMKSLEYKSYIWLIICSKHLGKYGDVNLYYNQLKEKINKLEREYKEYYNKAMLKVDKYIMGKDIDKFSSLF